MDGEQLDLKKCLTEEKSATNNNTDTKEIKGVSENDKMSAKPKSNKISKKAKEKTEKEEKKTTIVIEEKTSVQKVENKSTSKDKVLKDKNEPPEQSNTCISKKSVAVERKLSASESDSAIKISNTDNDPKSTTVKSSKNTSKTTKKKPNSTGNLHKKETKTKSSGKNKIVRNVQDNENPELQQTRLTQHFPVRRSERRVHAASKVEKEKLLEDAILNMKEDGLEVRNIEEKGRGVFSTKKFVKGDLVCEYAGELIDYNIAKEREARYLEDPEVGSYMYFFCYKDRKYCVDATKETDRLGRLLNHSKSKSNVCTKLHPINDMPRLILLAAQDIDIGEELVYDYGDRSKDSLESHPWLKL